MDSILMKIQDTVVKYAGVISKIAGTDVEVVDTGLVRVAGTGLYAGSSGRNISEEAFVYKRILRTGKREIIYSPGEEPVCKGCTHYGNCAEEIEIAMPVHLEKGGEMIGVIGLVGSSPAQKERILREEKTYLELLEQIADFISTKAREELEREQERQAREWQESLLQALRYTVNCMEQGALILNDRGNILQINQEARSQLEIPDAQSGTEGADEGTTVTADLSRTGYTIGNETEYRLKTSGREYLVLGNSYKIPGPGEDSRTLLLFRGSREVREQMLEIGAVIPSAEKGTIIGSSPATKRLRSDIQKIAKGSSTVLITGASGTGKEMVAASIWRESDRSNGKFIAINCAAIPEAILESELFGYVKGAFTGADPGGRKGKFELADKGVIFLDEIGDMPFYLQSKLLRVLQERKIVRIGSNILTPVDVRVLAATNKDLRQMVREGKFREDLYYRLNVIPLHIEPLCSRKEDIEDLVLYFAARFSQQFAKPAWRVTDRAMERLRAYSWPGNVRELENAVEYMVNMMGEDGVLGENMLPKDILLETAAEAAGRAEGSEAGRELRRSGPEGRTEKAQQVIPLRELERRELERALEIFGKTTEGKKKAAAELGISLAKLYRMEKDQDSGFSKRE